ncbi:Amino acid/polyamine transporter I [Niveomyces insectorum RCEF 264]|uniref:Amino acid/polyamine transporter I n=1 Tax=Niveomyces insectorum RCEF 264 TaxID=1081102 RepID=A0A167PJ15_9HYPO|nr:Amino acid/polyamine transporter I [Niveomyces insectorum RCEF 264]
MSSSEHDVEKRVSPPLGASVSSPGEVVGEIRHDYGADSELQRRLSSRHITMIALGSSIGMGLWLGSGTNLLSGSMIWSVSHSIGEMAVMYPLPSSFVQWTNKFVDPAAGFTLGWCYWFSYWITIANELQGVVTVLGFWTHKVPTAAWITIFWVVIIGINIGAVSFFGEIEVIASAIKFGWIFVVIISFIVISAGGAPHHDAIGFRYWNETHGFTHGFKGFLAVMPTCIFAMSGSENAGLVAAETENPRKSVPKAVSSIWIRLALFYILGSLMVTITVSPSDNDLFGGSGTNASPFVIAYRNAGLEPLAHIMNAVIFISVLSTGSISGYAGSRTLVGLAQIGMAPKVMAKADSWGRPWYGLVPTLLIGGGLAYINVDHTGAEVFGWFSNLTSLFTLFGWGLICLSHIRMRHAWKVQGRSVKDLPWSTWTWPWAAYWGLAWCIILMIAEFYLAIWPLGDATTAKNFFSVYVSVIAMIVIYVVAKLAYFRGRRWVDSSQVNLDESRRFYASHELHDGTNFEVMTTCVLSFAVPPDRLGHDPARYMEVGPTWPQEQREVVLHDLKQELDQEKCKSPMDQIESRGFAVVKNQSKTLGPLEQQEQWNAAYLEETVQLIKDQLGADAVFVWNSVTRSADPALHTAYGSNHFQDKAIQGLQFAGTIRPAASGVHVDQDAPNSRRICKAGACDDVFEKYSRVQQLNVWRPLKGPVTYKPLAVCDGSTVREKAASVHMGMFGTRVILHHDDAQKWYYIKRQEPDECLILKIYDSSVRDGQAEYAPHTGVDDLRGADGAETFRESIEVRLIVCYT